MSSKEDQGGDEAAAAEATAAEEAAAAEAKAIEEEDAAFKMGYENASNGVSETYGIKDPDADPDPEPEPKPEGGSEDPGAKADAGTEGDEAGSEAGTEDGKPDEAAATALDERFKKFEEETLNPLREENAHLRQRVQQIDARREVQERDEQALRERAQIRATHEQNEQARRTEMAEVDKRLDDIQVKFDLQEASLNDVMAVHAERGKLDTKHELARAAEQRELPSEEDAAAAGGGDPAAGQPTEEQQRQAFLDSAIAFEQAMFERHPNWQEIYESEEFKEWVKAEPLRQYVHDHGTVDQSDNLLKQWNHFKNPDAAPAPEKTPEQLEEERRKAAVRRQLPTNQRRSRTTTAGSDEDIEDKAMRESFKRTLGEAA